MLPLHPLRKPASCAVELGSLLREPKRTVVPTPKSTGDSLEYGQLSRKPKEQGLHDWMAEVLVRQRGVIAALPRSAWPSSASEAESTLARVVALDSTRAASKSWWWSWRLRASKYHTSRSVDEMTSVHTTDGVDSDANCWYPTKESYDCAISEDAFDRLTLGGFSTGIRVAELDVPFQQQADLKQRLLLELEAAATGLAPAVLAVFLVHSGDNYKIHQGTPALGTTDVSELPKLRGDSTSSLNATVSVTQATLFTLGDLLASYRKSRNNPLLRPSLPSVEGSLYELSAAIARRVRALADAKMLKLNITPDTVVFVPNLCEGEDGELQSQGYGYLGMETVRGVPMMFDFDPRFTKRFTSQTTDYDADCAYSVMMLILMASIRAQYGGAVQDIVGNKLIGRTLDGKPMDPSELPDDFDRIDLMATSRRARARATEFCEAMRSVTPSGASNREALSGMLAEAASDFVSIVESEVFAHTDTLDNTGTFDRTQPLFRGLINYLSRSTDSDTALFSRSAYDLEDEKTQSVEDRLMQLVLSRRASRA
jgi:hypothetical protein